MLSAVRSSWSLLHRSVNERVTLHDNMANVTTPFDNKITALRQKHASFRHFESYDHKAQKRVTFSQDRDGETLYRSKQEGEGTRLRKSN